MIEIDINDLVKYVGKEVILEKTQTKEKIKVSVGITSKGIKLITSSRRFPVTCDLTKNNFDGMKIYGE